MAKNSRPTVQKREKEKARMQKQQDKEARRADSKERKGQLTARGDGEDPDLVDIVAGPQPLPPERGGPIPER